MSCVQDIFWVCYLEAFIEKEMWPILNGISPKNSQNCVINNY